MKSTIKKFLPKNRFARSVSILAGGTATGQAIVVLASPVLTRLYSPEDFGLLAVYASLLGILGVVASLRYQLAIPLPEKDEEAAHVVVLSVLVVLGMTLVTSLVVVFFREPIAQAINTPALSGYLWLLPVGLLLMGIYQIFNYWAIRTKAFTAIARTKLNQAVSMVGVQIGGYFLGPLALILGQISGQAAGLTTLAFLAVRDRRHLFHNINRSNIVNAAKQYKRFPALSTWTGLTNSGSSQLPPLLIAVFLGVGPAGIYALTHRVLSMPMTLVGRAVGEVFYSEAVDSFRNNQLGALVATTYGQLTRLAFPAAVLFAASAPALFEVIFGASWSEAGKVAQIMTPWMYFKFVTTPSTRIFPILNMHGRALVLQTSLLFSSIIAIIIGSYLLKSLIVTVGILSVVNSFIYLIRSSWACKITGMSVFIPIKYLYKNIGSAIIVVFPFLIAMNIENALGLSKMYTVFGFLLSCSILSIMMIKITKDAY